jgi:hypothetical protein
MGGGFATELTVPIGPVTENHLVCPVHLQNCPHQRKEVVRID